MRQRGKRKLRRATTSVTGAEIARRARSAAPASIAAVTGGAVTRTGSALAPGVRSSCPSARTTTSAAAWRSRRLPACSGTTRTRRPRRTRAALRGRRSTSSEISSSTYSSAAFETAIVGSTSAPKTRARMRRKPRSGPNPSPARAAASTAALQSGRRRAGWARTSTPPSRRRTSTGCVARCSKRASSLAMASRFVRPPTSTPATCVPEASSPAEPANARPDEQRERRGGEPERRHDRRRRARTPARAAARRVERRFGTHRSANSRDDRAVAPDEFWGRIDTDS